MNWKHKIKLILFPDPEKAAKELASSLMRLPASFRLKTSGGDSLDELVKYHLVDAKTETEFDEALRGIYDWADDHKLWLEISYAD